MNLKNMFYFNIYDSKRSLTIFYSIIIAINIIFGILNVTTTGSTTIGGMEMASVIFIFISGLNSFKTQFHFGLVNGVSRKTQFISFMGYAFALAAFMALADSALGNITSLLFNGESMYMQLYGKRYIDFSAEATFTKNLQIFGEGLLWLIFLYAMMAVLGYCITLIYYRSNKIAKWVVSITPALVLFALIPVLESLTNGRFVVKLVEFMGRSMGLGQTINPYMAMISFIIGFGVLALFSFLLIRRAVIKQ